MLAAWMQSVEGGTGDLHTDLESKGSTLPVNVVLWMLSMSTLENLETQCYCTCPHTSIVSTGTTGAVQIQ